MKLEGSVSENMCVRLVGNKLIRNVFILDLVYNEVLDFINKIKNK